MLESGAVSGEGRSGKPQPHREALSTHGSAVSAHPGLLYLSQVSGGACFLTHRSPSRPVPRPLHGGIGVGLGKGTVSKERSLPSRGALVPGGSILTVQEGRGSR